MALDESTVARLKEKLLSEKKRLEAELGRFAKPTEVSGEYATKFEVLGTDQEDNATEVENYADNVALEGPLETQLRDVTDALFKMEVGKYGICEKTGEEIPMERLEAYPAARTLVDA